MRKIYRKRASHISSKWRTEGSFTVEAAVLVPIFLLFFYMVLILGIRLHVSSVAYYDRYGTEAYHSRPEGSIAIMNSFDPDEEKTYYHIKRNQADLLRLRKGVLDHGSGNGNGQSDSEESGSGADQ